MMDQRKAKWIMDEQFSGRKPVDIFHKQMDKTVLPEHDESLKNHHMLVRKGFSLVEDPRDACLDITADDYYKLYINGHFVGQGPAQSNRFHYYYNRYDISPFLQKGDNVIAVHVYYQGLICRAYNSGDYRQGLYAELTVGGEVTAQTDRSWKYHPAREYVSGGIIGYNTQYLENIDSRLKLKDWREPGFDDSGWKQAYEHLEDDHRLFLQPTPPLSVYEQKPKDIKPLAEGGFLIDFGQEITGQFKMKAWGGAGQTVEIRCGEELHQGGRVRYEMRCNCRYQEFWTLSGEEDELELYDYKGFRYVEVIPEAGVRLDSDTFSAVVRHYPLEEDACVLESSNPLLNSVWTICRNGVKFGSQENYVDCPTREKGQYLGDNTIITHAHAYLSGDTRLVRKALQDFALLSSRVCTGMMAVAPGNYMQEIADFSFQWPMQLLQYYKHSGDIAFLTEMYPVAEQMLRYFDRYRRDDGLLTHVDEKWNLVDWPEGSRDGYEFPKPKGEQGCHSVLNAFYFGAMTAVAEIRDQLQIQGSEDPDSFRDAFVKTFYNAETKLFVDSEGSAHSSLHANALPLLFGLVPAEAKASVVELVSRKRLSCGVYMAYFVLKALSAAGEYELVYDLITSEDLHSWGNMVKEGATTCFEAWSKELKWNTSLCHPWASAPVPLLIEEIIGLKPAVPGWKQVQFQPHLPKSLDVLKLQFRVPSGVIRFEYEHGRMALEVPEGITVV